MRKKYGFTLAETLLTILIIGIIAAATLPTVQKSLGDKNETMKTKCVYIMEQTIAQMLDDDTLYPQSNTMPSVGFKNTNTVRVGADTFGGNTKFCAIFASKIAKAPSSRTNCVANSKTFTSADGVDWYLPVSNFTGTREFIKIDVNGGEEDPNCKYHATNCTKPDIFEFYLTPMGKLYPAS